VGELHAGQWAFVAEQGARRLLIAIRDSNWMEEIADAASASDRKR
jgi:hypothetical protein